MCTQSGAAAWCCSSIVIVPSVHRHLPTQSLSCNAGVFSLHLTMILLNTFPSLLGLVDIQDDVILVTYSTPPLEAPLSYRWYGGIPCSKLVLLVLCRHSSSMCYIARWCPFIWVHLIFWETHNYFGKHVKPSGWQPIDKVGLSQRGNISSFATITTKQIMTRRVASLLIRGLFLSH